MITGTDDNHSSGRNTVLARGKRNVPLVTCKKIRSNESWCIGRCFAAVAVAVAGSWAKLGVAPIAQKVYQGTLGKSDNL